MKFAKRISTIVLSIIIICVSLCACHAEEQVSDSVNSAQNSAAVLSNDTNAFYEIWKQKYLTRNTYVSDEVQYYVFYSDKKYDGGGSSVPVTVSEANGYGMLIMAYMSQYDSQAKEYFDGMYRFYKAHPSSIGSHLMSWQQWDNGSAIIDGANGAMTGGSSDSASDGDLDIAYALLAADSIWGSDSGIDYKSEAIAVINDIMKYDVNQEYFTVNLGDWVSQCDKSEKYYGAVRCSDFMVSYFPKFAEATGDQNWQKVYDNTYSIINQFVSQYNTGLLPDFAVRTQSGQYTAAPQNFLEGANDGNYSYNSCRVPWRIAMDYILNGNQNALSYVNTLNKFISNAAANNPSQIRAGYTLSGNATVDYSDLCFNAPLMLAASCGENSDWHTALRKNVVENTDDVYFGDTLKLLCLIADDRAVLS